MLVHETRTATMGAADRFAALVALVRELLKQADGHTCLLVLMGAGGEKEAGRWTVTTAVACGAGGAERRSVRVRNVYSPEEPEEEFQAPGSGAVGDAPSELGFAVMLKNYFVRSYSKSRQVQPGVSGLAAVAALLVQLKSLA
jgi:hypothetical protein